MRYEAIFTIKLILRDNKKVGDDSNRLVEIEVKVCVLVKLIGKMIKLRLDIK